MDLVKILNQPPVCGKISLNMKKHQISTSYLLIELQLRSLDTIAQTTVTAQTKDISPVPVCDTVFSCLTATQAAQDSIRDSTLTAAESTVSGEGPADDTDITSSKSEVGGLFSGWF
jgi:hypothetical protein